jgi:aspartate/methionine/tyrosine aminotransferase
VNEYSRRWSLASESFVALIFYLHSTTMNKPWSKEHKRVFRGCQFSLSNSFANPLSHSELIELTKARGDDELLEAFQKHSLEYTPNGGSADLREEIAKLYGPKISAENILVFSGAQVALQTAAVALAADCHSIVFGPGYQSTVESPLPARNAGVTQLPRRASNGWQVDIQDVQAAVQADTKYMIINEPYNPAGTLMSPENQLKLKELAEQHDIVILGDEVYRLLEHDPTIRLPAICELYSKGISCVTLSKPWGGCGVTIGWLAVQDLEIKQRLVDVQYFGTACPSRASELQAIMTLRASDVILEKNLKIIRHNLSLLESFMERYGEFFEWVRPTAGAIAFVKFKGPLTSAEFGAQLAAAGISIKPAYCFTDSVTPEIDYFRVGFGEGKMPKALEALEAFVKENQQSWK